MFFIVVMADVLVSVVWKHCFFLISRNCLLKCLNEWIIPGSIRP